MITLKPNRSAINFKNMEKDRDNFVLLLYGTIEKENIDEQIEQNQEMVDGGYDSTGDAQKQLDYLKKLKASQSYQEGSLPRGIEKIILQIMESYTFWHSVNEADSNFFLTKDNYIHNLINVSITFMVSCELAKLFNSLPDDFSLNNIWLHDVCEIKKAKITSDEEIDYITEQFARNETTRDEAIKRFLDFRNKSVAHNTNNTGLRWSDFIKTMGFILRVWGILDEYYSPNCLPRPIQLSDQLYAPLQPYFCVDEVKAMKESRLKVMKEMFKAASTNLITGIEDGIRPFGDLKVTVKIRSFNE